MKINLSEVNKVKLYDHQKLIVEKNPPKYLLAHETGTGKSYSLLFLAIKNNPDNNPALLICIKSDKDKWIKLAERFGVNLDIYTKEQFKKIATKTKEVSAYDPKLLKKVIVKKTIPAPENVKKYNIVIFDEAHFAAKPTSMVHKSLYKYILLHKPEFIWLATATPYPNDPFDLYGLAKLLGHDWNYIKFRNHFFEFKSSWKNRRKGYWVKKEIINGKPLSTEIARYINYLGKAVKIEDCVDMPKMILMEEYFDLTAEQKRAINEVDEELVMTRNMRKHQICGAVKTVTEKDEEGKIISSEKTRLKSNKLNRLIELVGEHKKVFVVAEYQAEVDYIAELIAKKYKNKPIFKFTGSNSEDRPDNAKKTDDMDEVVVVVNAACSAAYECKTIPIMIFYSYDFSLVNYIQIIGRIRRLPDPNNPRPEDNVPRTYLSLIIKDSIDEDVFKAIQNKKDFDIKIYNK